MKTVTIADILNQKVDSTLGHVIYLIRDNQLVFYIGQSKRDVVTRFQEHMQKPSKLGRIVILNQPSSLNWSVDFYTLADCRPFVRQKTLLPMQAWEHFDMDMAESAMIQTLKPVVNHDFNPNPTPLPTNYRGHTILTTSQTSILSKSNTTHRVWLNKMSMAGWIYEDTAEKVWRHKSGIVLSDDKITPYRNSGTLPPIHKK